MPGGFEELWYGEREGYPYRLLVNREVRHVPAHWHDDLELVVVSRGRVSVSAAGRSLELEPGSFILLRPGAVHAFSGDGTGFCLVVKIQRACFSSLPGSESGLRFIFPLFEADGGAPWVSGSDDDLAGIVGEMVEAWEAGFPGFELAVRGNVYRAFGRLARLGMIGTPSPVSPAESSRFFPLFSMLETSFGEQWSDRRAADLVGLSYWHFCRVFKRISGRTFSAYVSEIRVQEARRLLADGDLPVGEIAVQTGFSSHDHLLRVFRRLTGMSPLAFRKLAATAKDDEN